MQDLFMVVCIRNKVRVASEKFWNFDNAFDYAQSKNLNEGLLCLILELDNDTMKWHKRLTIYPSEG